MNIIKNIQKAIAFTLAETLVVMGIIGVVAALTIPNLNQSTGNRETVTKLKKVYANLEDAFGRATAVYGPVEEWFTNLPEDVTADQRFADRMTEFMKISKDCGTDGEGCFSIEDYKSLVGITTYSLQDIEAQKILLADGTALLFTISNVNCDANRGASLDSPLSQTCGWVYVDIDGVKGSNTRGKDYFDFEIAKTGIYPSAGKNSISAKDDGSLKMSCFKFGACAGWIIETGNMDYLKATEGTCPNGTVLSWENTSCK